jgi:hypothetical protein
MRRKYLALIIVSLFIFTAFNSSIVAKRDISRPPGRINDILTMKREIADFKVEYDNAKEEFDKLDDDVIQDCIDSGDYDELLKFMGNENNESSNFGIERNVHINASGSGLYLVKRMKFVKIVHPYPRLVFMGIFPPVAVNLWLFYIKFNETYPELNKSFYPPKLTGNETNASTYIEYENGDPPKYINGSHTILALLIQIPPINKLINNLNRIDGWIKDWRGDKKDPENPKENDTIFKIYWPWSFAKWKFKHMWNYDIPLLLPPKLKDLNSLIPTFELLLMIMSWPFNIWTSFINLEFGSRIFGMAPFVIWSNSTAAT